jgi:hypothetical protein
MPTTVSGNLTTTTSNRQLTDGSGLTDASGTQLGISPLDNISFYGATPIDQPTAPTVHNVAGGVAGATGPLFRDTTFTGGTGTTAYTVGDVVSALKALGLIA